MKRIVLLLVLLALLALWLYRNSRKSGKSRQAAPSANPAPSEEERLLMEKIDTLVRSERLWQRAGLTVGDVAFAARCSERAVRSALRAGGHASFTRYINALRIDYAKETLRREPATRLSALSLDAGFGNEQSFFRTFKALAGQTPKEWLQSNE